MKDSVLDLIVEADIPEHVDIGVELNAIEANLVTLDNIGSIMRRNPNMCIRNVRDVKRKHSTCIIVNAVVKISVMNAQMIKHDCNHIHKVLNDDLNEVENDNVTMTEHDECQCGKNDQRKFQCDLCSKYFCDACSVSLS